MRTFLNGLVGWLLLVLASLSPSVLAQIPPVMSFQGYLEDAGAPADGLYDFTFILYKDVDVGDPSIVWQETHDGANAVSVTDGVYTVLLGSLVPLEAGDFFSDLWLGVAVNGGPELTPLIPLASAPYSFQSAISRKLHLPFTAEATVGGADKGLLNLTNFGSGAGIRIEQAGDDGVIVAKAGNSGLVVFEAGDHGLYVQNITDDGVHVNDAGGRGVYVRTALDDGVQVNNVAGDGIAVLNAQGWSMNIQGTRSGFGNSAGHIAQIYNRSTASSPDVLALKVGTVGTLQRGVNFITLFNGNDNILGEIQGNGSGGIEYVTAGADYAEYLPLLDPEETFEAGDVVGVFGGHISHRTKGADQVMVVTDQAAVLGNRPLGAGEEFEGYEKVSFIGQVGVKVRGAVAAGDWIVASGLGDGVAVAVEAVRLADQVVGRAWATAREEGEKRVRVAVGVGQESVLVEVLRRQQEALSRQEAVNRAQQAQIDELRRLVERQLVSAAP